MVEASTEFRALLIQKMVTSTVNFFSSSQPLKLFYQWYAGIAAKNFWVTNRDMRLRWFFVHKDLDVSLLPSHLLNHSSYKRPCIQIFLLNVYVNGGESTLITKRLKHIAFLDLPLTIGFSFSPVIEAHNATVILSLARWPQGRSVPLTQKPVDFPCS